MKKKTIPKRRIPALLFIVIGFIYWSCSADTLDFFIPNVSNGYTNISDPAYQIFFDNLVFGKDSTEASFTANVNLPNVVDQSHIVGSYKNTYIEFKYTDGPLLDKMYQGNFDKNSNPLRMTVTSGSESLTFQRNP